MNTIDIVILIILAFAIFDGVRNGLIIQGLSIVGLGVGIWLGCHYGGEVATLLHIEGNYQSVWGFIIVLVASIVVVAVSARIIRKLLQFAGFGLLDILLGAALSVCKFLLILSLLFSAFDIFNQAYNIVDHRVIETSKLYRPITNLSQWITPAWDWTQQQLDI